MLFVNIIPFCIVDLLLAFGSPKRINPLFFNRCEIYLNSVRSSGLGCKLLHFPTVDRSCQDNNCTEYTCGGIFPAAENAKKTLWPLELKLLSLSRQQNLSSCKSLGPRGPWRSSAGGLSIDHKRKSIVILANLENLSAGALSTTRAVLTRLWKRRLP